MPEAGRACCRRPLSTDLSSSGTRRSGLRCGCSTWRPAGGVRGPRYTCATHRTCLAVPDARRYPHLGEVAVADVNFGHALQPGAPQLRGASVGVSQTVLQIHQHLRILLVLLHLCCGHQDSPDPLGQVLHLSGERGVLQKTHQQQVLMIGTQAVISDQFLPYLERRIAVGKVVDDCQRLLEPGASDPCVCDQLTHCLDDLRWRDDCEDAELENKKKKMGPAWLASPTCRCERTIDFPLVNSKFFLMKK